MPSVACMAIAGAPAFAQVLLHFENDVEWGGHGETIADDLHRLINRGSPASGNCTSTAGLRSE